MGVEKVAKEIDLSKIPLEIQEEITRYEAEVQRFLRQEMHPEVFRRFRLQHGIYGQRQEGVQMVRVKIPFGGLNPQQLRCLAFIADEYSRGVAHVTTRQNVQFHFVRLERTAEIMRILAEAGLTTREACGNTVRNVTASPHTGVCPDEVFDVTPYVMATFRLFIRNPICENLPRKFKIAFSDCPKDAGLTPIHDIGLMAMRQPMHGQEVPGFRITVGGGLGPSPRRPYLLEEFVPIQDYLPVCEAVVRVFNRYGNRKNRSMARLKFLLEKIGFEEFYRLYQQEYQWIKETRDPKAYAVLLPQEEPPPAGLTAIPHNGNGDRESPDYREWLATNVIPQKQAGFCMVHVRLVIGDITSGQLRSLADISERYAHGNIRSTVRQNFVLRWISQQHLFGLYKELRNAGLAKARAETIGDVVACPGTDTCGLGITGSKGLGRALTELFDNGDGIAEDLKGLTIKVSGCPNSCAQHHIAAIGFHGLAHKVQGRMVPAYQLHLGGRFDPHQGVIFGHQIPLRFPAKKVPDVVKSIISLYREQRQKGEDFYAFVDRMGRAKFKEILTPYATLPSFEQNKELYYDWGEETDYELRENTQGECAGGMVDMVEQHLEDSKYELAHAQVLLEKGKLFDALTRADLAVVAAARGLLVPEGVDPVNNAEVMKAFREKTVAKGIVPPERYKPYGEKTEQLHSTDLSSQFARDYVQAARNLIEECKAAIQRMDAKLRIKPETPTSTGPEKTEEGPDTSSDKAKHDEADSQKACVQMDLRGVKCPMNYVKAKLRLEMMEIGELLELMIDDGEAYENVPRSLKDDGQKILEVEHINPHYRLVVEKVK